MTNVDTAAKWENTLMGGQVVHVFKGEIADGSLCRATMTPDYSRKKFTAEEVAAKGLRQCKNCAKKAEKDAVAAEYLATLPTVQKHEAGSRVQVMVWVGKRYAGSVPAVVRTVHGDGKTQGETDVQYKDGRVERVSASQVAPWSASEKFPEKDFSWADKRVYRYTVVAKSFDGKGPKTFTGVVDVKVRKSEKLTIQAANRAAVTDAIGRDLHLCLMSVECVAV